MPFWSAPPLSGAPLGGGWVKCRRAFGWRGAADAGQIRIAELALEDVEDATKPRGRPFGFGEGPDPGRPASQVRENVDEVEEAGLERGEGRREVPVGVSVVDEERGSNRDLGALESL